MENQIQNKKQKKIFFYNGLTKPKPYKAEKLHNELIDQYEELAPYARNKETGEILNPTDKYIYRKIKPKNIYKLIQSQASEADLQTKLKNLTSTDLATREQNAVYIDTTGIGNIHEEHLKTQKLEKIVAQAEAELKLQKEKEKKAKIIAEYEEEKKKAQTKQPQPKE